MSEQKHVRVDIISDVVCPWCVVGYRQLARAAENTGVTLDIHWHPFELNPRMPAEGQNLREHLNEKYGTTAEQSREARQRLVEIGADLDFVFDYPEDKRMVPTFRAHQLLHWAGQQGKQHALEMALFEAYFTQNQDVSDPEVLADAAAEVGLDRAEALAVLEDGRFADAVRQAEELWLSRGIHAVPAMVFNGRHLATGAQGVDNYTHYLQQLTEK